MESENLREFWKHEERGEKEERHRMAQKTKKIQKRLEKQRE